MKDSHRAIRCPLCGSGLLGPARLRPRRRLNGYRLHDCRSCGSTSAWPRVTAAADRYDYAMPAERWEFDVVADDLGKRSVTGSVLDIGCGRGDFLARLRNRQISGQGIDFNEDNVAAARSRGFDCFRMDLNGLSPDARYAAITAFHVIEHLDDPGSFLRSVSDRLHEDGRVYLSFPNSERAHLRYMRDDGDFPPHHLNRISADGMRALARRSGFTVCSSSVEPVNVNWRSASSLAANGLLELFGIRRWVKRRPLANVAGKLAAFALVQPYVLAMRALPRGSGFSCLHVLRKQVPDQVPGRAA